ncbi:glycosyltransferase family 39 protein [candidate division FCPU426 bacterium]|nr:glycosyltransferase family 39 protein [candidate division FCPU426 bacterium]
MAIKTHPAAGRSQPAYRGLGFILLAGWIMVIAWQTTVHFPWHWKAIALLFSWQRFSFPAFSSFAAHWLGLLKNLLLLTCFLITAQALGQWVLHRFFKQAPSRLDEVLYSFALGLILLSLTVYFMGMAGALYAWLFGMMLLAGTSFGIWWLWPRHREFIPRTGWLWGKSPAVDRLFIVAVGGFFFLNAIMLPVPETFFDSLVYHLAVPEQWILAHAIHYRPTVFFSNLPMNIEMLYTWSLLISDAGLCRLLHATLGLLAALSVFSLARRFFGRRAGLWAAGIFISTPVVSMNMQVSGVDVGAAFFAILAFMAGLDWGLNRAGKRTAVLAGILAGAALGCKYNTVFMLGPGLLTAWLYRFYHGERKWKMLLKNALLIAGGTLLLLLPWFVKNLVFTGNPVYPFLYQYIPSKNIHPDKMRQQMEGFREFNRRTWKQFLLQPWDLSFFAATSNSYIGTVYLFMLPGFLLAGLGWRRGPPSLRLFFIVAFLATLVWSLQTRITRYLIPILPLAGILGAWALQKTDGWSNKAGLAVRLTVIGLILWAWGETTSILMPHKDPAGIFLGLESREAYLNRMLMNSYTALARIINQLPGPVKVLIVGETRSFYIRRPATAATVYDYNPFIEDIAAAADAATVWRHWRSQGYTHVFIHHQEAVRTRGYEPYRWDKGAVERLQVLLARYLRRITDINQQQELLEIREVPAEGDTIKRGRPLFTYDTETVNTIGSHYNRAVAAMYDRKEEDARAAWMRIAALAPDWYLPYLQLGWFYWQRGDREQSRDMFETADRLYGLDANAYNTMGALHLEKGETTKARHYFQSALEVDPHMEMARKNLSLCDQLEKSAERKP